MKIKFSEEELIHLLYAWAAISLSFAIVTTQGFGRIFKFSENLLVSALTVGIAFLFHEISHKMVAQRYGCWAEFRKFDFGLILAVLMSFFGLVFAAPGAVFIFGPISEKENGKIALSGPLSNLFLAVIFLFLMRLFSNNLPFLWGRIINAGFSINSWLAFFNLLPFPPLDGSQIINWSLPMWFFLVIIAGIFVFLL